jgi:SAM-dependent methyltransferase
MGRSLDLLQRSVSGAQEARLLVAASTRSLGWPVATTVEEHLALGEARRREGRYDRVLLHARRALELGPTSAVQWSALARLLAVCKPSRDDVRFRGRVVEGLRCPGVDAHELAGVATWVLEADGTLDRARALRSADLAGRAGGRVLGDPLLLALLSTTVVADPGLELVLVAWRRWLLQAAVRDGQPLRHRLPFLAALATHCLHNEFAFRETAAERRLVERLGRRPVARLGVTPLLLLACYRPLHTLPGAARLPGRRWPAPVGHVLRLHVEEPLQERHLRETIPVNAPSGNAVSALVRAQYEESPYPRWVTVEEQQPTPLHQNLRLWFPHVVPPPALQGRPRALVAGCGTGRHAILRASRHREVDYLAVDLSLSSLAYAARMADARGLSNLRFQQADILALPDGWGRFEVIECGGVLNCFEDPLAGWRALVDRLVPGGLMCVALYSFHARAPVRAVWDALKPDPRRMTTAHVREARATLLALPEGHPARAILRSPDFYSLSGCRDLLFHVQELQFTLPQVEAMIRDVGLSFLGFELNHPAVASAYRALFPEDPSMTSLARWDLLERAYPDTFGGMYQFWCQAPP